MNDSMHRLKNVPLLVWAAIIIIFLLGILATIVLRFLLVNPPLPTHYHANFALYVNGQKDEFKDFTFYEEVQACGAAGTNDPLTRLHMHNQKNYEVHVHDSAATWGHLFANFNYGLTNKLVQTSDGIFVDGINGNSLTFILNGKQVSDIYNRTVDDVDVLLINYGNEDLSTLMKRFEQIPHSAKELDAGTDPASCTGLKSETFSQRLKRTIGVSAAISI